MEINSKIYIAVIGVWLVLPFKESWKKKDLLILLRGHLQKLIYEIKTS